MTAIEAGVVDVFVIHAVGTRWKVLLLRRGAGTRSPGSWEAVHGRIEPGEKPSAAARRELREETGLDAERLYSLTVNPFYLAANDTVQLAVAFAAFVGSTRVTIGEEHEAFEWLTVAAATKRFTWPREVEGLAHAQRLLGSGSAGVVEDVLRMAD